MNVQQLLSDLRRQDIRIETDGTHLLVDAPRGVVSAKTRRLLLDHKPRLISILEGKRNRPREADGTGLAVTLASEPGWIALRDPLTGEWHEVKESECLPSLVEAAHVHHREIRTRGPKRSEQA